MDHEFTQVATGHHPLGHLGGELVCPGERILTDESLLRASFVSPGHIAQDFPRPRHQLVTVRVIQVPVMDAVP